MNEYEYEIKKDTSGITYSFSILKNKKEIYYSDGFKTEEEIKQFVKETKTMFNNIHIL